MTEPFYSDDAVTLYHGDCLDILPQLDEPVDHVITDPPYEAEAHTEGRRIKTVGGGGTYGETGPCVLDFQPITDAVRQDAAAQFARLAARWVLVFCQVEAVGAWREALTGRGLSYRRACAWLKRDAQPQLSGDRPGMGYESIVCAHASGRSTWNGGGKRGVYETVRASTYENREALHMTEKPILLMSALVADFTDEGETILDPFAGSGTTGVAAKLNGRKAILIECEEKYCEVAAKRLRETEPGRLFDKLPKAKPQSLLPREESA
jgi:site-specific DNA-methyltransferase (adenine-specific)